MLDEIHASNIGLIAKASLSPSDGLTVITGETGTGKTLMLGALRLVRGDNASKDSIGPHDVALDVVARFVGQDGGECVIRRTVSSGRSRAYIDGSPVTTGQLNDLIASQVTIVSQHDQHALTSSDRIRVIVDGTCSKRERTELDAYVSAHAALVDVDKEIHDLGSDPRALEREREMLIFQMNEIDEAGFAVGDEEALRASLDRLRNAEELTSDISIAVGSLNDAGARDSLSMAIAAAQRAARVDANLTDTVDALTRASALVDDIAGDLSRYAHELDTDPAELAHSENRLAELMALKRKYGDSIAHINTFARSAAERAEVIRGRVESVESVTERHQAAEHELIAVAQTVRQHRIQRATEISLRAMGHLVDLGFSDPLVTIDVTAKDPTKASADHLKVMFASDRSLPLSPVGNIASGGELSRLFLAITLAAGGIDSEVVVFDEIDSGVGGSVALALGEKLQGLAKTRQVICVTHLPQVAAFGDRHYMVTRSGATTSVDEVTGPKRIEEISRMLAGLTTSDKGKEHAEELLAVADRMALSRG